MINPIGLKPHDLKVAAIQRIPYPTSVTAMEQLLGIINYYRKFLKDCSQIARPLNELLLKKGIDFLAELEEGCKGAIDKLAQGDAVCGAAAGAAGPKEGLRAAHGLGCCGVRSHLAAEGRRRRN
jgi:hypothetical protein